MSARRSTMGLKDRGGASSSDNIIGDTPPLSSGGTGAGNGTGQDVTNNGSASPDNKKQRSCMTNGRLCLLQQSRGGSCWLILFLITAIYAAVQKIMEQHQQEEGTSILKTFSGYNTNSESSSDYNADRVYFESIQISDYGHWAPLKGKKLFDRALYQAKPRMMGMLLIADNANLVRNYNTRHRRRTPPAQRQPLNKQPPQNEQFQLVRINPTNHIPIHYVDVLLLLGDVTERQEKPSAKQKENDNDNDVAVWQKDRQVEVQPLTPPSDKSDRHESRDALKNKPDKIPEGCVPQYDWQLRSFPNCNEIHQLDVLTRVRTLTRQNKPESVLLARGGYRDVWMMQNNDLPTLLGHHHQGSEGTGSETVAMKTLLYDRDFTERNTDRHRRDAVATERLSRSPHALDLYGYCSNTGLYEFANGGSLEDLVGREKTTEEWKSWNSATKMKFAYQVAQAIADVHNIDKEGLPSMSHTDITLSQFVSSDGGKIYKINDFNRARLLYRDELLVTDAASQTTTELCKFDIASNKGKFRSPEEYAYLPETAAIDTYSMGNIFYVLLTGEYPFGEWNKKEVAKMVKRGERPEIPDDFLQSNDPFDQALIKAMKKCWVQDINKRATSREIQQFLKPFALGQ